VERLRWGGMLHWKFMESEEPMASKCCELPETCLEGPAELLDTEESCAARLSMDSERRKEFLSERLFADAAGGGRGSHSTSYMQRLRALGILAGSLAAIGAGLHLQCDQGVRWAPIPEKHQHAGPMHEQI
jgi:hypothetical protein